VIQSHARAATAAGAGRAESNDDHVLEHWEGGGLFALVDGRSAFLPATAVSRICRVLQV